jgi:hypothetical protein
MECKFIFLVLYSLLSIVSYTFFSIIVKKLEKLLEKLEERTTLLESYYSEEFKDQNE